MTQLRAFVVDDEPLAVRRLTRLLETTGRATVVGSARDAPAALQALDVTDVDVLFLDIEMPGLSGFDLLARLPSPPMVVFTTAYSEHAVRAFEVNSIDYLLKPIERARLEQALDRCARRKDEGGAGLSTMLERLESVLRQQSAFPDRLASRVGERVHLIELTHVTHFFAKDKLTFAAADGRADAIDATIAELERKLDPGRFVRIHRAIILNLAWVQDIDTWFGGRMLVRLKDVKHTELTVARDRVRALRDQLSF